MKLEDIGFYTLSDARAKNVSVVSPMKRAEILITGRCNFKCPYCRGPRGGLEKDATKKQISYAFICLAKEKLENIRFSGGEPTLLPELIEYVSYSRKLFSGHIAISTNGSASQETYDKLLKAGVDDFSISLDACCASMGKTMSDSNDFDKVVKNIKYLSKRVYTTVGIVLTEQNIEQLSEIVLFAMELGVSDIRIIPAAQENYLQDKIAQQILKLKNVEFYKILKYRLNNLLNNKPIRGISLSDTNKCFLTIDDSIIIGDYFYPCVIYAREGGKPINKVNPFMREQRIKWMKNHNSYEDSICRNNCLDVCVDYNNKFKELNNNF